MLEVLDTAGQEDYISLRDQWIRDGEGFVLVYSISSRASFQQLRSFYNQIRRVKESSGSPGYANSPTFGPSPVMLVGNKCDRVTEREVSTQEGSSLARELGCDFVEASAKNCVNVEKAFYDVVRNLRRQRLQGGSRSEKKREREPRSTGSDQRSTRNGRSKSKSRGSKCVIL
jgi:GTPase KRas protein